MDNPETFYDVVENYRKLLDQVVVPVHIFVEFTLILFCVCILRLGMLIRFQQSKSKIKKITDSDTIYIFGHILFEFITSFIVCYLIIKLTFCNPESYIINYIIGPAVGILFAIWFNNGVLIKLEGGQSITDGGEALAKFAKKKSSKDNSSQINININGNDNSQDNNENAIFKIPNAQYINEDDINNENFDKIVVEAINQIKNIQIIHASQIENNTEMLNGVAEIVDIIRESEMNDKKIELKKLMYACLDQGYATPEQNDMIVTYFKSYKALHGNGEIESLYNDHYVKLDIHNMRAEKTNQSQNSYGKYDLEYLNRINPE